MKVACDICEKVEYEDDAKDWWLITMSSSKSGTFSRDRICPRCSTALSNFFSTATKYKGVVTTVWSCDLDGEDIGKSNGND